MTSNTTPTELAAELRKAANEMRAEHQNGWPNLCDTVADYLASLTPATDERQADEPLSTETMVSRASYNRLYHQFDLKCREVNALSAQLRTDERLAELLREARGQLNSMIPTNMSLDNTRWPDSTSVPIEATLGELRAVRAMRDAIDAHLSRPRPARDEALEEAAKVAERFPIRLDWPQIRLFEEIANRIRTLKGQKP